MRVLIVGGGIAGLVLAAKLRQQGRTAVIAERAPEYGEAGYALGLYPLGSCVLHGLGVYEQFEAMGVLPERYEVLSERGDLLTAYPMSEFTAQVGPLVMISRSELLDQLRAACDGLPIRMGTTVSSLEQEPDVVSVQLSDGSSERFDLVVGCDGIDSEIRDMVFGAQEVFDTGWALRTWWTQPDAYPTDVAQEYWGAGKMLGIYSVRDRSMVVAGAPAEQLGAPDESGDDTRARLRELLSAWCELDPRLETSLADSERFFLWPMTDVRSSTWHKGRVALCGDSAAAFLPTAGVGASCAMRAAAALADELSRADAAQVPLALDRYERRAKKIIEANQTDSRQLARYMFVKSRFTARLRNAALRIYPAKWALSQIIKSMKAAF